jgi:hypothetical protein
MRFGKKLIGAVLGLGLTLTPAFTFAADRHVDRHDDRGRPAVHEDFRVQEIRGDRDRDRDHVTFERPRVEVVVPAHVGLYAPDCR